MKNIRLFIFLLAVAHISAVCSFGEEPESREPESRKRVRTAEPVAGSGEAVPGSAAFFRSSN